jgi:hypothetical protein
MGTRCLTEIMNGNQVLVTMYRQFDGYLTGHGAELQKAFGKIKLVNGISGDDKKIANGLGCLAAQVVAHFKDGPGGIYIEPPGARDVGEEYIYILSEKNGKIWLQIYEGGVTYFGLSQKDAGVENERPEAAKPIYSGTLADFDAEAVEQQYHTA